MVGVSFANPGKFTHFSTALMQAGGKAAQIDLRPSGHGSDGGPGGRSDSFTLSEHSRVTYSKKARPAETPQTDASKPLSFQINAFNTKLVGLLQEIGIGRNDEEHSIEGHSGEADWEMTLTFAENADGNIVVFSAELDGNKNQQLTALINEDATLVEQIKSLSAALKESRQPVIEEPESPLPHEVQFSIMLGAGLPGSEQPGVIVINLEPLERVKNALIYEPGNMYQNKDGSTFIIPPDKGGEWKSAEAQEIYERMHSAVAFSEAIDSFMTQVVAELETLRTAAKIEQKEWTQNAVSQIFDWGAHFHIEGSEEGKATLFARPQDWSAFGKWANDVLQKLQTVREQFVGGIIDDATPTTQAPPPYLTPNFGSAAQNLPLEENANTAYGLTIKSADTAPFSLFAPPETLTLSPEQAAMSNLYREVFEGTADNPLLQKLATHLLHNLSGSFYIGWEPDMKEIDAIRDNITQGIQEAREILELRDKLGFKTKGNVLEAFENNRYAERPTYETYSLVISIVASNPQWDCRDKGGWGAPGVGIIQNAYTTNAPSDADTWSLDWLRQAAASREREQAVDSDLIDSAQPTNASLTGAYAKIDADGNKVPFINLLDMDYESASPKEQNLIDWAKRISAIHQWEQANDFSFNSSPTTPEGKKAYNDMLLKAMQEGVQPLHGFRGSLNKVEGTDWMIADGAEALIGHEILSMFENAGSKFGTHAGQVNEYGFTVSLPGSYQGTNYHTTNSISLQMESLRRAGNDVTILWDTQGVNPSEFIRPADVPVTNIRAPIFGMDGGQTYMPEITFTDALGLGGMSLGDRKMFLALTQKILDEVMPGMDARELRYSTGQLTDADVRNNTFSLTLDVAWLSIEQRTTIEQALNQDRRLFEMKHRADMSGNQGLGEFTISVLDSHGNALAKDQVRLTAGNKSIITSVDNIRDMDQQQILGLLNRPG